jgi:hypothetical protein
MRGGQAEVQSICGKLFVLYGLWIFMRAECMFMRRLRRVGSATTPLCSNPELHAAVLVAEVAIDGAAKH